MGRIYLENNGKTTILFNGEAVSGLTASANTYYVGTDLISGNYYKKNPDGSTIDFEIITGSTGTTGGIQYTAVTLTEFQSLSGSTGLTEGVFYRINDAATSLFGGTDIILQATGKQSVATRGTGLFYDPNSNIFNIWSNVIELNINTQSGNFIAGENIDGDGGQTGLLLGIPAAGNLWLIPSSGNWSTINSLTGQSSNTTVNATVNNIPNYTAGTKVIWGGFVWQNVSGTTGVSTDVFTLDTNWTKITYNTNDYILVQNTIDYEPAFDNIAYRNDGFNEVRCPYAAIGGLGLPWNTIKAFPWGRTFICKLDSCIISNLVNLPNNLFYLNMENGSQFNADYWGDNSSSIGNIRLGTNAIINSLVITPTATFSDILIGANNSITNVVVGANSSFTDINIEDGKIGAHISDVKLYPNSLFGHIDLYKSFDNSQTFINNVTLSHNATFFGIILNGSSYADTIFLGTGATLSHVTMGILSSINNIVASGSGITINSIVMSSNSNISALTFNDNTILSGLVLDNNSTIYNVVMYPSGNLSNTKLGINASINNTNIEGVLSGCSLGVNSLIQNINIYGSSFLQSTTLGVDADISNISISGATLGNIRISEGLSLSNNTFTNDIFERTIDHNNNNFPATIDITGLSDINLSPIQYAGEITITSSNGTETISTISNSNRNYSIKMIPYTGLSLTVNCTATGSISAQNQITFTNPSLSLTLNGSTNDFVTVKNYNGQFVQILDFKNYL